MLTLNKKTVLIVEDEYFLAQLIQERLEYLNYGFLFAGNGQEAIDLLRSNNVNLIIMDIMMPVLDGLEATKIIKSDPNLKKIPVVFLTARGVESDKKQAYQLGADDYLTKPFSWEEFMNVVKRWLE